MVFGLSWAVPAVAVDDQALAECAAIANNRERLACFDRLAASVSEPGAQTGQWQVIRKRSVLEDQEQVQLKLLAAEPIPMRRETYTPVLTIACKDGGLSVVLDVGLEMDLSRVGRDGTRYYEVAFRYDGNPLEVHELAGSDGGKTLRFPDPGATAGRIAAHRRVSIRLTPFNRDPVQTRFDLEGFARASEPLRHQCSW